MDLNRRQFLRGTSIAATLTGLTSLPVSKEQATDPLGVRKDFAATREYTFLNTAFVRAATNGSWPVGESRRFSFAENCWTGFAPIASAGASRSTWETIVTSRIATAESLCFQARPSVKHTNWPLRWRISSVWGSIASRSIRSLSLSSFVRGWSSAVSACLRRMGLVPRSFAFM